MIIFRIVDSGIIGAGSCGGCDSGHRDTDNSILDVGWWGPARTRVPNLRESRFSAKFAAPYHLQSEVERRTGRCT